MSLGKSSISHSWNYIHNIYRPFWGKTTNAPPFLELFAQILTRNKNGICQLLAALVWHPVLFKTNFRVVPLVYTAPNGLRLSYLANTLVINFSFRTLRSTAAFLLEVYSGSRRKITNAAYTHLWRTLPAITISSQQAVKVE